MRLFIWEDFQQDVRHTLRLLRRSALFAITAVVAKELVLLFAMP